MFLESDQKLVNAIPAEIYEKINHFSEELQLQVGYAWNLKDDPLPENYVPELVDVFVDGSDEACLSLYKGSILSQRKEFFADRHKATIVILIEENARYVEINGELIANSLGGCLLPDIIVSPAAQVAFLTGLLNK